jgi:LuxR family maltose regulon positive regulatory protein
MAESANAARTSEVAHRVPVVLLQSGIGHLHAGNLDAARTALQRAHRLVPPGSGSYVAGAAAGKLALVMSMQGHTAHTEHWLQEYESAPSQQGWLGQQARSSELVARAWSALDRLDLDVAAGQLADVRNDLVQIRQGDWPVIAYVEALYGLLTGQAERALRGLVRATNANRSLLERGALAHVLTGSMRAELLLALGRANQARATLDTLPDRPSVRIARARLALISGHPAQVLAFADDYQWFRTTPPRLSVEMLVLKAVAHHRNNQAATASATLGNAIRSAAADRLRRPFTTAPRRELLEIGASLPEDATEFLGHRTLITTAPPYPAQLEVIALTERERHIVTLMADGQRAQQIAATLFLSYNTVRTYQRQIYRKLGASSQAQAVSLAKAYGLLAPTG